MFTDAEFALIAREVKSRSGYVLTREMSANIETRLMTLQRREGLSSVSELINGARADGRLWDAIAEGLAVSETRFFRDRGLFQVLRSEVLPALFRARAPAVRLNVWSAGCSTGQEAYSLAILLEDLRQEGFTGGDIVATDFSERLLDKARAGLFTQFEVQRGLPIRTLITHFEKVTELWRISDRLRALIRFEPHNLLNDASKLGRFDLVLCCNILNGFDAPDRRTALANIAAALAPDGVLITGAEGVLDSAPDAFAPLGDHIGVYRRVPDWRRAVA